MSTCSLLRLHLVDDGIQCLRAGRQVRQGRRWLERRKEVPKLGALKGTAVVTTGNTELTSHSSKSSECQSVWPVVRVVSVEWSNGTMNGRFEELFGSTQQAQRFASAVKLPRAAGTKCVKCHKHAWFDHLPVHSSSSNIVACEENSAGAASIIWNSVEESDLRRKEKRKSDFRQFKIPHNGWPK